MLVESGKRSLRTIGINNGMSYAITNQQRFKNLDRGKIFAQTCHGFLFCIRLVPSTSNSD